MWKAPVGLYYIYSNKAGSAAAAKATTKLTRSDLLRLAVESGFGPDF